MKTYEKYKDSGIEWIGAIPEHWEVKRFGFIFSFYRGLPITKQDLKENGIPCVSYGEIHSKYGFYVDPEIHDLKFVDDSYLESSVNSLLNRGDFVFADTSEDIKGSGNFTCLISEVAVFAGYHTIIARQKTTHNYKYFAYFFDSIEFRNQIRREVSGIKVYSITQGILKNTSLLLPTLEDQINIATYLDRKTTEIDRIIANKQKLIALYEEEKQAIINQAVTKGLDPNVKMKDSGVEWLGEIPEHWQVKKLKWLIEDRLKYGANESAELEDRDLPRYIRITDFGDDGKLRDETFKSLPYEIAQDYLLEEGDILFARSGATVGKTFQFKTYKGKACFAGYLIKAKPNKSIESDLLYNFTKSGVYDSWKNSIFNQATIQNIGADKYAYLELTVPPINEQKSIVVHIEKECTRLDAIISKFNKQIELLQEYRTTLISDVVTGKLKVPQ